MKKRAIWLVHLLGLVFFQSPAQEYSDTLNLSLGKALNFLKNTQEKKEIPNKVFEGEWPSYMNMSRTFFLLGKSQKYRDSNCFTASGIFNALAESYFYDSTQTEILPMLALAHEDLLSYRKDDVFNFWKLLPANRDLSRKTPKDSLVWVRRPTHFKLKSRFINNAANIAFDADDTAMGNLANFYYYKIFEGKEKPKVHFEVFDLHRDTLRNNYHWHNFVFKIPRNSGAYLTWLAPEDHFKRWNFLKAAGHNLIFFSKASSAFPRPYHPYVPWGANDLDAVVNANVLTYLGNTKQLELSQGYRGAKKIISFQINKERWSRAGHYYPNRYHFHYASTRSALAGVKLEDNDLRILLAYLSENQKKDGHYESRKKLNKKDKLQSTIYALLALLNLKEANVNVEEKLIANALKYILKYQKPDGSWEGGVFFSGGTVVRNVLFFQSDAYTTALMVLALNKYKKIYPSN
jgi:citrate lyase gamma subunit